ncbi:MAG: hypothetical protein IT373_25215 [Polyangiaceae bacterium]|nr:hypothetical protein [Polyangiaceae bacterium]
MVLPRPTIPPPSRVRGNRSPASEVARFPSEVRKADHVAGHILVRRAPLQGAASRPEATPADGVPAPPPSAPYGVPIGQA